MPPTTPDATDDPEGDDPRSAVAPHLAPGEVVLWAGRPEIRRFRGEIRGEMALGLILGALGLILAVALLGVVLVAGQWGALIALLIPTVFGLYAAESRRAPQRYREATRRAAYAVTDRRALVVDGFGYSRKNNLCEPGEAVQSFGPTIIGGRSIRSRRRDGTADIVFDREWRDAGKRRHLVEFGFFGVAGAEEVDRLLDRLSPPRKPG